MFTSSLACEVFVLELSPLILGNLKLMHSLDFTRVSALFSRRMIDESELLCGLKSINEVSGRMFSTIKVGSGRRGSMAMTASDSARSEIVKRLEMISCRVGAVSIKKQRLVVVDDVCEGAPVDDADGPEDEDGSTTFGGKLMCIMLPEKGDND